MLTLSKFIEGLKPYRHILPKQTIQTLKGQAIAGDIVGATKGLATALSKKQDNKNRFINAHRSARYITKLYDVNYMDQVVINLKNN